MALDWQNALAGGATGALTGLGAGTALGGPLGAGLGALGGSILGAIPAIINNSATPRVPNINNNLAGQGNFLTGYAGQQQQLPRFTPMQQSALEQLLQQGLAGSNFENIENRARTQFQTKTLPSIAERFAGLSSGPGGSSRFRGALGAAASDLEQGLAALRSQNALQLLGLGLKPSFENIYIPGREGLLGPIAQGGSNALVQLMPLFLQWLQNRNAQPAAQIGQPNNFQPQQAPEFPSFRFGGIQ